MNNNLSRGAASNNNENQSSINLSLSFQNKSILMSIISEFSRSGIFKFKNEGDKQKCEAITSALEVIEKNSELTNENNKHNETIKVLEAKNTRINNKSNELKAKMENSTKDYTANIDKKNETIKELEQRNIQTIKELSEFQTKKTTSGPEFNITNASGFVFNKENGLDDENFKQKYESANKIIQEKDLIINKLKEEIVRLKLKKENHAGKREEVFQKGMQN